MSALNSAALVAAACILLWLARRAYNNRQIDRAFAYLGVDVVKAGVLEQIDDVDGLLDLVEETAQQELELIVMRGRKETLDLVRRLAPPQSVDALCEAVEIYWS